MTKTHFRDLINNIKNTRVAFFSIILFVMLGMGLFLGCSWLEVTLVDSSEEYLDNNNVYNLNVIFPYGFSDEDIETIKALDLVENAEGSRFVYDYFTYNDSKYLAKICQMPEEINLLTVKEGQLPSKEGEIAVDAYFAENNGIQVGDTISFVPDADGSSELLNKVLVFDPDTDDVEELLDTDDVDENTMEYLKCTDFTITAIVNNSLGAVNSSITYGSDPTTGMSLDTCFFVDESSFKLDSFLGYMQIYIVGKDMKGLSNTGDEYLAKQEELETAVYDEILPITTKKVDFLSEKLDTVYALIDEKFAEAEQEIEDGKAEVTDGEAQIADGEEQLAEAKSEIESGEAKLADAEVQIADGKEQLAEGKAKLEDAQQQLADGAEQLAEGQTTLKTSKTQWSALNDLANTATDNIPNLTLQLNQARTDCATLKEDRALLAQIQSDIASGTLTVDNLAEYLTTINAQSRVEQLVVISKRYASSYNVEFKITDEVANALAAYLSDPSSENGSKLLNEVLNMGLSYADNVIAVFDQKIDESAKQLEQLKQGLAGGKEQLNYYKYKIYDGENTLNEKTKEYNDGLAEYNDGLAEYNEKSQELEDGIAEYEEGKQKLIDGKQEYAEKMQELEEGKQKLLDGKEELADAIEEYNTQLRQYDQFKDSYQFEEDDNFTILTRTAIASNMSVKSIAATLDSLKYSLAGLFVLVGFLVCYSSITRIVNMQIRLLGTKKALGYSDREITLYYICYIGLASVIGCTLGVLLGLLMENVLITAVGSTFDFEFNRFLMTPQSIIIFFAFETLSLLAITYLSSKNILRRKAIELLNVPPQVKNRTYFFEKWKIWSRTSNLTKIIVNNFVIDKRRVIGTIIGITGCAALIVAGLTFRNDIMNSYNSQFRDFYHFKYIIYYDDSEAETAPDNIQELLDENNVTYAKALQTMMYINTPDDSKNCIDFFAYDNADDAKKVVTPEIKLAVSSDDVYEGAWVGYSIKNNNKDCEDTFTITNAAGDEYSIPVSGYMVHYLSGEGLMISKDAYETYVDDELDCNSFICNMTSQEFESLESDLQQIDGYVKTVDYQECQNEVFEILESLVTILAAAYMVLAVIMSILVIYSLLSQFIDEKKRELIVMLINGFSRKDAKRYIYSDTILLTVIGIVLGVILGTIVGIISVISFDTNSICFVKSPDLIGILAGIFGSAILSFLMCLLALRKIDKFVLTDISKL